MKQSAFDDESHKLLDWDGIEADQLLDRMDNEWYYDTKADFDAKGIKLSDTAPLFEHVDKLEWLTELLNLRWYGPFNNESQMGFFFRTVSDSGEKFGFSLMIQMDNQDIFMSYLDKQEYLCGDEQEFKSKESEDDPYNNIKG